MILKNEWDVAEYNEKRLTRIFYEKFGLRVGYIFGSAGIRLSGSILFHGWMCNRIVAVQKGLYITLTDFSIP